MIEARSKQSHFFIRATRLRTQLILSSLIIVAVLFGVSGYYLEWKLERTIENELSQRLMQMAKIVASSVAGMPLTHLTPDPDSRTARYLQRLIADLRQQAGLSRIVIATPEGRVLLDSENKLPFGSEYIRFRIDEMEVEQARKGKAAASPLFYDVKGDPFKAAYAPIVSSQKTVAVVGVEARATGLNAIREARRTMMTLGALGIFVAIVLSAAIATRITRPLERLTRAAGAVGAGEYQQPIEAGGSREVMILGQTLKEMREAILNREQRQRMMLAGIAHEIRNPLGGIELFADLLKKQCPAALRDHAEKILTEVRYLKQLVNDFLEFARPARPEMQPVQLGHAIREAIELLGEEAAMVDWKLEGELDSRVYMDPDHLRRVLINILKNSCEALRTRPNRKISLRCRSRNGFLELVIADSGPGIPPEARDKIFEPFYTTRSKGTGLGLAIVRQLLEANGATISLQDAQSGAAFHLMLPAYHEKRAKAKTELS